MAHPKHILVVDDDGDVRNVVVDMLREHGHWVSGAIDGKSMRDILTLGVPFDDRILPRVFTKPIPSEPSI